MADFVTRVEQVIWHRKWLTHFLEKVSCRLHSHVSAHVPVTSGHLVADPRRDLVQEFFALVSLVCKDHHSIVVFRPQDTAYTLAGLAHGIEHKEILLSKTILFVQVLHASAQVPRERILERDSKNEHAAPVMTSKIDAFRDLSSCDGKENSAPAIITGSLVVFQRKDSLHVVLCLNENEFVFQNLGKDAHLRPFDQDVLHVLITREEADHSVGHDG